MALRHEGLAVVLLVVVATSASLADADPPRPTRAPARNAPPPDDSHVTAADADTSAHPAATDRPLLRVGAAVEASSRHFAYVSRLTSALRPYDLFAAPLVALRAEVSPFARSDSPALSGLGLAGGYAHAFALASADANGNSISTTWQALYVDLRERLALGQSVLAGAHAGFGAIDYSFGNALGSGAELPNVGYRFLRMGLDGQITFREFALYGQASYLDVLSAGMMGTLFPRETVGGVDARAGVIRPISNEFDASLELAYTRFFYAMRPEPGDANVAGGALDEMVGVSVGLSYRM